MQPWEVRWTGLSCHKVPWLHPAIHMSGMKWAHEAWLLALKRTACWSRVPLSHPKSFWITPNLKHKAIFSKRKPFSFATSRNALTPAFDEQAQTTLIILLSTQSSSMHQGWREAKNTLYFYINTVQDLSSPSGHDRFCQSCSSHSSL